MISSFLRNLLRHAFRAPGTSGVVSATATTEPVPANAVLPDATRVEPSTGPLHTEKTPTPYDAKERPVMKSPVKVDHVCGYKDVRGFLFSIAKGRVDEEIFGRAWLLVERNDNPHKIYIEIDDAHRRALDPTSSDPECKDDKMLLEKEKEMWPDGKTRLVPVRMGKRALGIIISYPDISLKWRHIPHFRTNDKVREDMGRLWGEVSPRVYKHRLRYYIRDLPPLPSSPT
jgi:hypothetical protein